MIGLVELLREHAADLDADFLSHYGLDLALLGTAALPWGRFNALLYRLPPGSHFIRTLNNTPDDEAIWSPEMFLIAGVTDLQQATNFLLGELLRANGAKKNPVSEPKPMERPGMKQAKKNSGLKSLINALGSPNGRIG
ncbi:hypothetical protein O1L55_20735 [Streptomyces albulus]|nr:hypothetical protein [Streptomyces noursei]